MSRIPLYGAWSIVAILISGITGCGKSIGDVSVHGLVSYRGEPLSSASLTFFPESGRPITAPISDQGEYDLKLLPGNYSVIVNVGAPLPPGFKEGDPVPPPKIVLPPQYTTQVKTPLKIVVGEESEGPTNFEIK